MERAEGPFRLYRVPFQHTQGGLGVVGVDFVVPGVNIQHQELAFVVRLQMLQPGIVNGLSARADAAVPLAGVGSHHRSPGGLAGWPPAGLPALMPVLPAPLTPF